MLKYLLTTLFVCAAMLLNAQQTVGVFLNDEQAFDGYTLFFPGIGTETYLIDNCGREVHRWSGEMMPGSVCYLLENGQLLRALRLGTSPTFVGGGIGGRVELVDWDGEVLWQYDYASPSVQQHHDVAYLPNGNVLILAWELKTNEEAIANGRDPDTIDDELWPDHIVEVEPDGFNGGNIVWEWHFWDHLIQDFDSSKDNYGVVADHPELIDINYTGIGQSGTADWQHCNSIHYNAERDEIIISSRTFNEFYIIDHSTTTEEAAGHTGGNSGKGGDILYRWGNPEAYQRGDLDDRRSFGQHDAQWIEPGNPDAGKILFYNNGVGRPGGSFSTADIIDPPLDADGKYILEEGEAYGPENLSWSYGSEPLDMFFSPNVSGAQQMPNGNILICEGAEGHIFEVDQQGNKHWDYVSPISLGGPLTQGETPVFNALFRAYRYGPAYPAFNGKDLTPGAVLELNPTPSDCVLTVGQTETAYENLKVYPNPFDEFLVVESDLELKGNISLWNLLGQKVFSQNVQDKKMTIETSELMPGLYILELPNKETLKLIHQ